MLGKCFGILVILSIITAAFTGNLSGLSNAAIDGASNAVNIVISLTGMMCLWGGIMNVLSEAGVTAKIAKLLSPLMRLVFPDAFTSGIAKEEITSAVCANFLGIGNAATPLALEAMRVMDENSRSDQATDDMVMLTLTAVSPLNLLPTTVITLRKSAGALSPYNIIVPVWICSAATFLLTVVIARSLAAVFPVGKTKARQENSA